MLEVTENVFDPRLPLTALTRPIVWRELFGRAGPVEIDIGCGKGRFLIESGRDHPERSYLGVERSLKYARMAAEKLAKTDVRNARVLCMDALALVTDYVADASVAAYHVLHPDPWPKKRHHKRRVVSPAFVEQVARTLRTGGVLRLQTDVDGYVELMAEVVGEHPAFEPIEWRVPQAGDDFDGLTSFERKYLREGRSIHRAAFRRRA